MIGMMTLPPIDENLVTVTSMSCAVLVVSTVALAALPFWRRDAAVRHAILLTATICCLLIPLATLALRVTGTATATLPWRTTAMAAVPGGEPNATETPPMATHDGSTRLSAEIEPATFIEHARSHGSFVGSSERPGRSADGRLGRRTAAVLAIVWAAGWLVAVAGCAVGAWRLARLRRRADALPRGRVREIAATFRPPWLDGMTPPVRVSEWAQAPMACGVLRREVILPARLVATLGDDQLRDVLAHEFAHLRRHDPLFLMIQRVAGILFWPIVTVHLVNRQLDRAREEICDNFVLKTSDPISYGRTLLRVARTAGAMLWAPGAVGMLRWRGRLEDRIGRMIDERHRGTTRISRWAMALPAAPLLALGVGVSGLRLDAAPPDGTTGSTVAREEQSPSGEIDNDDDDEGGGEKARRVVFQPKHGMANKTNWTNLAPFPSPTSEFEMSLARVNVRSRGIGSCAKARTECDWRANWKGS